jgi:outer membrane protein assembly factor BamA
LRPVSLIAAVYAEGEPIQFYRDRRVESAYDYRRFGGSLGFRSVIFEALQFRLDGVGEWAAASLQEGTDLGLDRGEGQLGFTAAAVADSYDRFPFPRRGTESVINYDYRYQPAAERGFNRLSFEQQYYLPLFDRSALGLGFRFSTDFSSETPFYRRAFLGGFGSFSGLYDQELTGRHSLVGSGELRFNIFSLPLGAGDKVYLSLKGDLGTIWDGALVEIRNDPEFILGGSAGFSADTIFGQVHLHFALAGGEGLGDDPLRYTTYLLLGNRVEAPLSAGYR